MGGAVVWATPVVQTLGMGRAFAQTASPVGKDISYIGINVDCGEDDAFFVKWEDGGGWEDSPGAAPSCEDMDKLPNGVSGAGKGFKIEDGPNDSCRELYIPDDYVECDITVWVKAGTECRTYSKGELNIGEWTTVCSPISD